MKFDTVPWEDGFKERLKDLEYALGVIRELAAENARLREALEKLAKGNRSPGVLAIARAALEGK